MLTAPLPSLTPARAPSPTYSRSVFMGRQFAWATKRLQWSNNIVKQFHAAARRIQQLVRHRKARRHRMATKIQAVYRGWHYRMTIIMARRDELRRIALVRLCWLRVGVSALRLNNLCLFVCADRPRRRNKRLACGPSSSTRRPKS